MAGNRKGGLKAVQTNLKRHGKNFYKKIGQIGGSKSCNGGFASEKIGKDGLTGVERSKKVGRIGGLKSRRGPAKKGDN